ncbi:UDP-glycosyltransferase 90A1-like [Typha latifolia]|uniref:UDP-glycosyltransferase 90A1-like n=1 Tax=Typha latifolia TaxID=4733 RepID=UPI003C2BB459
MSRAPTASLPCPSSFPSTKQPPPSAPTSPPPSAAFPTPSLLIYDGFHFWAPSVADELGIPTLVFYGIGGFSLAVSAVVMRDKPHSGVTSPYESFPVQAFPNLRLTKADLEPPFDEPDPTGPMWDIVVKCHAAAKSSRGHVVNSFYELEKVYFDRFGSPNFCVGPLCLARDREHSIRNTKPSDITQWLDSRLALSRPVLYVAFGSQVALSPVQLHELAVGLDLSGFDYLWVVRVKDGSDSEFLTRVGERGKVVRDWVDQMEVLGHDAIQGFMSHCGWNSVMESMCMGVPILAWPMLAEQRLNAKFVVEELRMGIRVRASDGTKEGLVKGEDVEKMVRMLMAGEEGKSAARRAKELEAAARKAMEVGGSSYVTVERMMDELCGEKKG